LEEYKKRRDEEREVSTAEKKKEAEKKKPCCSLARLQPGIYLALRVALQVLLNYQRARRLPGMYFPIKRCSMITFWIWLVKMWKWTTKAAGRAQLSRRRRGRGEM
jgi:hypothetical protein